MWFGGGPRGKGVSTTETTSPRGLSCCPETGPSGFGGGPPEKEFHPETTSPRGLLHRTAGSGSGPRKRAGRKTDTAPRTDFTTAIGHTARSARPLPYDHSPSNDERDSRRPTARPTRWTAPRVSAGRVTCAAFLAPTGAALWRGRPYGAAADKQWARAAVARLERSTAGCARRTSVLCSGRAPSTVHWRSWRSHSPRNRCGSGSGPTGWPPTGTAAGRLRGADPHLLRSTASRSSSYISLPRRS